MTEFILTEDDDPKNIDLGNSKTLTVNNLAGATVKIYIDRNSNGSYTSAVKGTAGYTSPIILHLGNEKTVQKSDLISEQVRVGVDGVGAKIKFRY